MFDDEASTVNVLVPAIEAQGVHAVVVLIHQGGGQGSETNVDGCSEFSGPIVDIVHRLSPEVRVVVSGHTHRAYNCTIDGRLVTSASSFGRVITDIDLTIDGATDRLVSAQAKNEIVTRDVPKDAAASAILAHYRPFYATLAHRVIGAIDRTLTRRTNAAGESELGDLVADADLEAARRIAGPDVAAAFTNMGGLRADLALEQPAGSAGVSYEDLYNVQPFGNTIVVKTMTGEMIGRLLEQQFASSGAPARVLQISGGLSYMYDPSRPAGERVDRGSIQIAGQPVRANQSYRVAANEYLASGGDGLTVFTEGSHPVTCGTDLDALVAYVGAHSPVAAPAGGRIVRTGSRK
jgi:5'-nucleotidase